MGIEYNQFGEECKSRKQANERKFVWIATIVLDGHVFA
jgi:hypothetical protein